MIIDNDKCSHLKTDNKYLKLVFYLLKERKKSK